MKLIWRIVLWGTFLSVLLVLPLLAAPNETKRAGVVIDFGSGRVNTYCVTFTESSLTGYELLQRTGLPIDAVADASGVAVCRIGGATGTGCSSSNCFCQFPKYWSYWNQQDGAWVYSNVGPGSAQVSDGMVNGWLWGDATQPPAWVSLTDICTSPEPTPTHTPTPTYAGRAVTVDEFYAEGMANNIVLHWHTASESGNLGFYLWRNTQANGNYSQISELIPSEDDGLGADYQYEDANVTSGVLYYYKLQDVPSDGAAGEFFGPITASIGAPYITPTPTTPVPPLALESFTASGRQRAIQVSWQTDDEAYNRGFTLLRSRELTENYTPIAYFPSGNFRLGADYRYLDTDVMSGTTYVVGVPFYYKLQNAPLGGAEWQTFGPVSATLTAPMPPAPYALYLPVIVKHYRHLPAVAALPPITCTLTFDTQDSYPTGNHTLDNAATVADYTGQALVAGAIGEAQRTWEDYYRFDHAIAGRSYRIMAYPNRTINYDLGMIVYNEVGRPILTDSTATDGNSIQVVLTATTTGPYYFRIFQRSEQCSGATYQLFTQAIPTPTPTPIPPLAAGDTVRFLGAEKTLRLEGVVTASEKRTVLFTDAGQAVYPYGVFVIALMDMTNYGLESDLITLTDSIKLQDGAGHKFDMAEAAIQQAAADTFDRPSAPFRIQPGFTVPMVFVFDALPGATGLHLVAVQPW